MAGITPAVVGKLVDALQDGVALTDADGTLALANLRLEEMFGYPHAELIGRPVESLVPADLQAAHRGHRAAYARAPRARPMGAGARLVALRKDGTTFPAEISLSPVATATGTFTLTVIRDVTEARRLADLADLARAAVAARQAHDGQELLDSVTTSLYHLGLSLQAAADLPHDAASKGIAEALQHLDDTIRQIRDTAFTIRGPQNLSRTPKRCRVTPRRAVPGAVGRQLRQARDLKASRPEVIGGQLVVPGHLQHASHVVSGPVLLSRGWEFRPDLRYISRSVRLSTAAACP